MEIDLDYEYERDMREQQWGDDVTDDDFDYEPGKLTYPDPAFASKQEADSMFYTFKPAYIS